MQILNLLLKLLAAFAELAGRWRKLKEASEYERSARDLQQNPPGWFDQHFNSADSDHAGVREPAKLPGNAADTGKADATKPADK